MDCELEDEVKTCLPEQGACCSHREQSGTWGEWIVDQRKQFLVLCECLCGYGPSLHFRLTLRLSFVLMNKWKTAVCCQGETVRKTQKTARQSWHEVVVDKSWQLHDTFQWKILHNLVTWKMLIAEIRRALRKETEALRNSMSLLLFCVCCLCCFSAEAATSHSSPS